MVDVHTGSKRIDTLVSRMMEVCEKEGATLAEIKGASTRFQRVVEARVFEIETETPFSITDAES